MITRRSVLASVLSSALAPRLAFGQSANPGSGLNDIEHSINAWVDAHPDYFDPPHVSPVEKGSKRLRPDDKEVRWAAKFLANEVPTNLRPSELARWMMLNVPPRYVMEWPPDTPAERKPANPLRGCLKSS